MKQATIEVALKRVVITASGACLFLGNASKIFIVYVDTLMGEQIRFAFSKKQQARPVTSDLIRYLLCSFDIRVQTIVLYHADKGTFYAKMVAQQMAPMMRISEIDLRPSDAILISLACNKPIVIDAQLFASLSDASDLLENFTKTEDA